MNWTAGLGAGLSLLGLLPKALLACTCVVTSTAGAPTPQPLTDRPVVVAATALWVDISPDDTGPVRQRVTLLPEASWRGPAPDTVTLIVTRRSPCANYMSGGRYLVFADVAEEGITTGRCDVALSLSYPTAIDYLGQLGSPAWIATSLDDYVIPDLVSPDEVPAEPAELVRVGLGGFPSEVTHVELAGDRWTPGAVERYGLRLPPGIYAGRVHWRGGQITHLFLGVRCEASDFGCYSFRFLQGLDVSFALESR